VTTAAYELIDLTHYYGGHPALSLRHLAIRDCGVTGIVGPNGSGKSTLLKILAFLITPTRGRMLFRGKPAPSPAAGRKEATLLLQQTYLLKRSVFENVAYGLKVRGDTAGLEARVREALEMAGLAPDVFIRRQWRELSGGEARRVALASRLALRPRILLLDEPTGNLDKNSSQRIKEAALTVGKGWGTTLVIASHDMNWLETVADVIIPIESA